MVFGLFKKKEPVKCTIKPTGEEFVVQPDTSLMKAAFAAGINGHILVRLEVAAHVEQLYSKERDITHLVYATLPLYYIQKKLKKIWS